jgi:flagellar motility protein MotE (MotC chaperone)
MFSPERTHEFYFIYKEDRLLPHNISMNAYDANNKLFYNPSTKKEDTTIANKANDIKEGKVSGLDTSIKGDNASAVYLRLSRELKIPEDKIANVLNFVLKDKNGKLDYPAYCALFNNGNYSVTNKNGNKTPMTQEAFENAYGLDNDASLDLNNDTDVENKERSVLAYARESFNDNNTEISFEEYQKALEAYNTATQFSKFNISVQGPSTQDLNLKLAQGIKYTLKENTANTGSPATPAGAQETEKAQAGSTIAKPVEKAQDTENLKYQASICDNLISMGQTGRALQEIQKNPGILNFLAPKNTAKIISNSPEFIKWINNGSISTSKMSEVLTEMLYLDKALSGPGPNDQTSKRSTVYTELARDILLDIAPAKSAAILNAMKTKDAALLTEACANKNKQGIADILCKDPDNSSKILSEMISSDWFGAGSSTKLTNDILTSNLIEPSVRAQLVYQLSDKALDRLWKTSDIWAETFTEISKLPPRDKKHNDVKRWVVTFLDQKASSDWFGTGSDSRKISSVLNKMGTEKSAPLLAEMEPRNAARVAQADPVVFDKILAEKACTPASAARIMNAIDDPVFIAKVFRGSNLGKYGQILGNMDIKLAAQVVKELGAEPIVAAEILKQVQPPTKVGEIIGKLINLDVPVSPGEGNIPDHANEQIALAIVQQIGKAEDMPAFKIPVTIATQLYISNEPPSASAAVATQSTSQHNIEIQHI